MSDSAIAKAIERIFIVITVGFLAVALYAAFALLTVGEGWREIYLGNRTWNVSQTERDALMFLTRLQRYHQGAVDEDFDEILERFDVFWSRLARLDTGNILRHLDIGNPGPDFVPGLISQLERIDPLVQDFQPGDTAAFEAIHQTVTGVAREVYVVAAATARSDGQLLEAQADEISGLTRVMLAVLFGGGLSSMAYFATHIIRQRNLRREISDRERAQRQLAELNRSLEDLVACRTSQLRDALDAVNDAYGVIQGSITYAARIQRALLPDLDEMRAAFADIFVLWEPRDQVGGDMYWFDRWGNGVLLMLCDCTGHGVPGAFMTLILSGALERAKGDVPTGDLPALIGRTHRLVQTTLRRNREATWADEGIELGACLLRPAPHPLAYVGAGLRLLVVDSHGRLSQVAGTRKGIGYRSIPGDQVYPEVVVPLVPDQRFYITSDGLIDQIGGPRRRSFGRRRLATLLTSIHRRTMTDQQTEIRHALARHQGNERRRDDVSMIGFRVI